MASGGVVFTTIQKFFPEETGDRHPVLSDRRNVVVIADEAHRSQYDFIDGFARHLRDALPNASFIGFTGTPIETDDVNTRAVFGDYIDIYDISRAVEDGATVPIYYESRLAKLELRRGRAAEDRRGVRGGDRGRGSRAQGAAQDASGRSSRRWSAPRSASRWSRGPRRRTSRSGSRRMDGKAMVVCMSRRICVDALRRDRDAAARSGTSEDDDSGRDQGRHDRRRRPIRSTGSRTSASKPRREALAKRVPRTRRTRSSS